MVSEQRDRRGSVSLDLARQSEHHRLVEREGALRSWIARSVAGFVGEIERGGALGQDSKLQLETLLQLAATINGGAVEIVEPLFGSYDKWLSENALLAALDGPRHVAERAAGLLLLGNGGYEGRVFRAFPSIYGSEAFDRLLEVATNGQRDDRVRIAATYELVALQDNNVQKLQDNLDSLPEGSQPWAARTILHSLRGSPEEYERAFVKYWRAFPNERQQLARDYMRGVESASRVASYAVGEDDFQMRVSGMVFDVVVKGVRNRARQVPSSEDRDWGWTSAVQRLAECGNEEDGRWLESVALDESRSLDVRAESLSAAAAILGDRAYDTVMALAPVLNAAGRFGDELSSALISTGRREGLDLLEEMLATDNDDLLVGGPLRGMENARSRQFSAPFVPELDKMLIRLLKRHDLSAKRRQSVVDCLGSGPSDVYPLRDDLVELTCHEDPALALLATDHVARHANRYLMSERQRENLCFALSNKVSRHGEKGRALLPAAVEFFVSTNSPASRRILAGIVRNGATLKERSVSSVGLALTGSVEHVDDILENVNLPEGVLSEQRPRDARSTLDLAFAALWQLNAARSLLNPAGDVAIRPRRDRSELSSVIAASSSRFTNREAPRTWSPEQIGGVTLALAMQSRELGPNEIGAVSFL